MRPALYACLSTLAGLAAFALAGCGPKVSYKYRVAVIPKGLTHEFWQSIHRGADRAAEDLKAQGLAVEVLWDGPRKESDAKEQIGLVQEKVGQGIHGLVLAPQDSRQMVPVVEEAVERGIPVVIIDSGLDPEALRRKPDLIVKYIATDNYNGGRLGARRLLETLAKEGKPAPKLVLLRYQVGSESTEQREKGFLDYVRAQVKKRKDAGKPAPELLSSNKYAESTVESAEAVAGPLLTGVGKEADGIFTVNESSTVGMLNALRSLDRNGKVRLVGFDSSEPLIQGVEEGDVDALVVQDPYRMGYLGVWTMVQHLEGYDVRAGKLTQSTGEYLLTKANLQDRATRERFDPDFQARRKIELPEYRKK
jgi:ribose transport system substrate-binding protein